MPHALGLLNGPVRRRLTKVLYGLDGVVPSPRVLMGPRPALKRDIRPNGRDMGIGKHEGETTHDAWRVQHDMTYMTRVYMESLNSVGVEKDRLVPIPSVTRICFPI